MSTTYTYAGIQFHIPDDWSAQEYRPDGAEHTIMLLGPADETAMEECMVQITAAVVGARTSVRGLREAMRTLGGTEPQYDLELGPWVGCGADQSEAMVAYRKWWLGAGNTMLFVLLSRPATSPLEHEATVRTVLRSALLPG